MRHSSSTVPAARPRLDHVFPPSRDVRERRRAPDALAPGTYRLRVRADYRGWREQLMVLVGLDRSLGSGTRPR